MSEKDTDIVNDNRTENESNFYLKHIKAIGTAIVHNNMI